MKIFNYIKKLFSKPVAERAHVKTDPYAPRGKNTPYPLDEFAVDHIQEWLDEVYWKHHG